MPTVTRPDNIPAPAGTEGIGAQIFNDMTAAVQAAITSVRNLANSGIGKADAAQARADLAVVGMSARHRTTTQRILQSSDTFTTIAVDTRQFGWTGSQQSGVATRIYFTRPGVYLVGGDMVFLPPSNGAAVTGFRDAYINFSNAPAGAATAGQIRASREVPVFLPTDMIAVTAAGQYIEIMARQSQGEGINYRSNLWATYVGTTNPIA